MKRNLVAIFAVALAVAASSFTTKKVIYFYMYYNFGPQKDLAGYDQLSSQPNHLYSALANPTLDWFRATDTNNDNIISTSEFNASFESYDVVATDNNLLSDESADISGELDLINKP